MSPRTTPLLTITGTLLLGMVLGGLLTGAVIGKRAQTVLSSLANEATFVRNLDRLLAPANDRQRDSISVVLHHYGKIIARLTQDHRARQAAMLDSMKHDLDPHLTPEQQQRLAERLERAANRQRRLFQQEMKEAQ